MVGGETLPSDLASEMVATGASVVNLYGPTEATIWASVHKVSERDVAEGSPAAVSIGRPLEGYAMYVLDARCLAVPDGAVGELYIAGAGLARGYLKRPGWTAERFLPDPFGSRGGRMYRTGDLARRRADGALEFMGRCDHQVKVRGFRIELGEIETALRRHGCVQDAAVVIHGEGDLKRLAAFVILQPNGVPGDSAPANAPAEEGPQSAHLEGVRQYLREQLPDYMIPATITVLDAWPLTPSGKLNRKALPVPSLATTRPTTQSPETEQERAISVLFAEVLGLKEVSLDDDFFELGGHSMLAMRLTNYMRSFLGVELSIRELFKAPTVRLLARHVSHLPLPS